VWVDDRRYVVCRNEDQALKDAHDRLAIVAPLIEALKRGDKALIGNNGYRRFVIGTAGHWRVDEVKVAEEARYDGKWVLRTNPDLSAAQVALKYKQLWTVEAIFRTMKSQLDTRPIFHRAELVDDFHHAGILVEADHAKAAGGQEAAERPCPTRSSACPAP
jgi:hypothetical protein